MYHKLEMVVAMNAKGLIAGVDGMIPWNVPEDLHFFQELTKGGIVIMGRKTWQSLPVAHRPLRGRINIIMTREPLFKRTMNQIYDNVYVVNGIAELWALLGTLKGSSLIRNFIIGGAEIYRMFLPICEQIYVTEINYTDQPVETTYFPLSLPELQRDYVAASSPKEWLISRRAPHTAYRFHVFQQK